MRLWSSKEISKFKCFFIKWMLRTRIYAMAAQYVWILIGTYYLGTHGNYYVVQLQTVYIFIWKKHGIQIKLIQRLFNNLIQFAFQMFRKRLPITIWLCATLPATTTSTATGTSTSPAPTTLRAPPSTTRGSTRERDPRAIGRKGSE